MRKYIDNYGNEITADYCAKLPIENNRQDVQSEEIWRRLIQVYSLLKFSSEKELLRVLIDDIEYWMEEDSIKSPKRWEITKSEINSLK